MVTSTTTTTDLDALGAELLALTDEQLARALDAMSPDDLSVAEYALGKVAAVGWRATPSTMAAHFDASWKRWAYVELLGQRFREAADGTDPHQIWMLPSQYGKTTMLRWAILWILDRDPTTRILYLSYNADKAVEEGGKARDLAERYIADLSFRVRADARARGDWKTTEGGGLYSTGINGTITGFPQDVLLLDDLIKGWQAAHSTAQRELAWSVYRSQARLRIQSPTQPIIIAGTRWHEDDPQARVMKMQDEPNADQWSVVRLPAIAEAAQPDHADPLLRDSDPLGRPVGQVLEAERFPLEEVLARQAVLGSYLWAAMEQQRPAPAEGGEIKRAWWNWTDNLPETGDAWISSWDMKMKEKESGDYQVGQVWSRTGSSFFLHAQLRGQWTMLKTACAIALLSVRHPLVNRHYVENTGNGPEVMTILRGGQNVPGGHTFKVPAEIADTLAMTPTERKAVGAAMRAGIPGVIPVTPQGDKIARARAVAAYVEAPGCTWLPNKDFAHALVNECAAFPTGAHDDMVDTWSQAMWALTGKIRTTAVAAGEVQASNWRTT